MKVASTFLARRALVCGLAGATLLAGSAAYAGQTTPRLAIKDYDPVSYFTPGKPMPGSADISYEWDGARWQFANTAHRELFQSNPDAYAPQYGGYCALGMTTGNRGEVNPEVWAIVDGKLYLNYEKSGQDEWRENQAANIARADQNWAKLKR
jgi:YHS domain-containing protein